MKNVVFILCLLIRITSGVSAQSLDLFLRPKAAVVLSPAGTVLRGIALGGNASAAYYGFEGGLGLGIEYDLTFNTMNLPVAITFGYRDLYLLLGHTISFSDLEYKGISFLVSPFPNTFGIGFKKDEVLSLYPGFDLGIVLELLYAGIEVDPDSVTRPLAEMLLGFKFYCGVGMFFKIPL